MVTVNRVSLWETTSSVALIGMGAAGIVSPVGLHYSTFFSMLKDSVPPIFIALFVFSVGFIRLMVLLSFYRSDRARFILAVLALMVWAQWTVGFAQYIPTQGIRPGVMQMLAMVFGEVAFVYFLRKGRWD